jgi:hypothetical protein
MAKSEWLLLNAKIAIFQLYMYESWQNMLHVSEITMIATVH